MNDRSKAQPVQGRSRSCGYVGFGLGVILLEAVLGVVVLGYLARPALELAIWGPTPIPVERPAIKETPVQPAPTSEATPQIKAQANSPVPPTPTSTRVVKETPTPAGPAREPTSQLRIQIKLPIPPSPIPIPTDLILAEDRHFQGNNSAPITMIEFSDFKCPYCGLFATETFPQLRRAYIDTGQVRFIYKHMAILGPESDRAAAAAECATEQGRFWEYHDLVFGDQAARGSTLNEGQLIYLADQVGLDRLAFSRCLASGRYAIQVRRETEAARAMGLHSTPSFSINGVFMVGAQPFEAFQQVIEEQLRNR